MPPAPSISVVSAPSDVPAATTDLVCVLDPRATPRPGLLEAYQAAFAWADDIGAAYGRQLPAPGTSPMAAHRMELRFGDRPAIERAGGDGFLSLVNACYRRECWPLDGWALLDGGWAKAYVPDAAVTFAPPDGLVAAAREAYESYGASHAMTGWPGPGWIRPAARAAVREARADGRWMRARGYGDWRVLGSGPRLLAHHAVRRTAAVAATRGEHVPRSVVAGDVPPQLRDARAEAVGVFERLGSVPLREGELPERLRIALLGDRVTRWRLEPLMAALQERGHAVGDETALHPDLAIAADWPAVYRALRIPGLLARLRLRLDDEAATTALSAEQIWAEQADALGLPVIAGSRWLAERFRGTAFTPGVDPVFHADGAERRPGTVVFHADHQAPELATPLGTLALEHLHALRPDVRFVLFGHDHRQETGFPYEHLGKGTPQTLAPVFRAATAGLSLSLTAYPRETYAMLASGLPVVALDTPAARADLPDAVRTAPADPDAIAQALARVLDEPGRPAPLTGRTWAAAAEQVEAAIRA